jgi:flagellar biosynthesis protein FliR
MLYITTEQIGAWIGSYFWPFVRISALFMAAPVFGAQMVPVRIRIMLAFTLSLLVAPMLPAAPGVDPVSLAGMALIAQQILIGVAMGFMVHMVFQTLVIAGEAMANGMGLGFARMVDPANGVQVPVISQFLIIMATMLFVTLNGHLMLIDLLVRSFEILPIGAGGLSPAGMRMVAAWGSQMFIGALLVALPAVTAMLVVNISMGVITRAAPQLNIFAVGFPLMILLGFIFIALTTPAMLNQFTSLMMDSFDGIIAILGAK